MTRTEATQEDGTEKENTEMGIKSMSTIQMPIMTLNHFFFNSLLRIILQNIEINTFNRIPHFCGSGSFTELSALSSR